MFTFLSPKVTVQAPTKLGPDCTACGLISKCRHPKQVPQAVGNTVVLIDSPEDRSDGLLYEEKLQSLLAQHNVSINSVILVAASACAGDNPESWKHCQPLMIESLKQIDPETIIVLGRRANDSIVDYLWQHPAEMRDRWYGRRIPSRELNAWVYPIGFAGRMKDGRLLNPEVSKLQHFRWLRSALRSTGRPYDIVPDYSSVIRVLHDRTEIKNALKLASASTFSAFDYETNHLKCTKLGAKVYSMAVAWLENGNPKCVSFMCSDVSSDDWRDYLLSTSHKIAANLKFETRWSHKFYGVEPANWAWDTVIASHMADAQMGISGLKFQAFVSLGLPFYAKEVEKLFEGETADGFNLIHRANPSDLLIYNAIDAVAELDLGLLQMYEAGKQTKYWSSTLPHQKFYQPGVLWC